MLDMSSEEILLLVIKFLKENQRADFQRLIEELQPYDIALIYIDLPSKHKYRFLTFLKNNQIAWLIQELQRDLQMEVLHKLGVQKSSEVMDLMENDDLADLLEGLSLDKRDEFLTLMEQGESQTVQSLLQYPPETAGGIMTNRYVWIRNYFTVREAVDKLKSFAEIAESIYYLYVLDEEKKLVGVISYRDLLLADDHTKIGDIMFKRVISVPVHLDQEQVARIIERYDFIAVPVVDEQNRLVGIVTVDDVIDVMIQEADEDIRKFSATGSNIDFNTGTFNASIKRLPWLVLLLFIGIISGSIISHFEETLQRVVALAFFMPMIAGMTGNTGTQSLAVVVRGLAGTDIDRRAVWHLIMRELGVGIIIGLVCGTVIAILAYLWQGNYSLGLVVGISLFITLIIGTLAGTVIPLILYRFRVDPAVASGPLISTLNDIFSLSIYFTMANLFISKLI